MIRKILIMMFILLCNSMLLFSQNCHIGDIIINPDGSKGVVFWVNQDRTEGWMVAMEDASSGCQWGNNTMVPNLPSVTGQFNFDQLLSELDGKENTKKIREKAQTTSSWPTPYAAGVVDYDNDWYLPSVGQLRILFGSMPKIEELLASNNEFVPLSRTKYYWASTQSSQNAWVVKGADCSFFSTAKTSNGNAVRAIRTFTMTGGFASYQWSPIENITADLYVWQEGEYTVTVTMGNGCSAQDSQTITVDRPEDSEFSATACGSYGWEGDTYTTSGNYTKTFTSDAGCEYQVTLHLTIIDEMTVDIIPDDTEICEGESTTLHAVVSNPDFYAPGDILCTDGTVVKPANWPVSGKTAKGIVFYVDASGQHGWAVDKNITTCQVSNDLGNSVVKWSSNKYSSSVAGDVPGLPNYDQWKDAITDYNGYSNTQIIRDYTEVTTNNVETFPAAWSVDFENGWYIPAAGQLNILFGEILVVNASLTLPGIGGSQISTDGDLWSSTEFSSPYYTYVRALKLQLSGNGSTGRIMHDEKKQKRTLRAVIDF